MTDFDQERDRDEPEWEDELAEARFPVRSEEAMEQAFASLDFAEQDCFAFLSMLPSRPSTISVDDIAAICKTAGAGQPIDANEFARKLVASGLLVPCDRELVMPPEVKAFAAKMLW